VPAAAGLLQTSVSAHLDTSSPVAGEDLTIAGTVTGATTYPASVTLTRSDDATFSESAMTDDDADADGTASFHVTDPAPPRGDVTYTVTEDLSTASDDVPVRVPGKDPHVSLIVSRSVVPTGRVVRLTGHLRSTQTTNRKLTIFATPYKGDRKVVAEGSVDASGDLDATYRVIRRTTFAVRFTGDKVYRPQRQGWLVSARAIVRDRLGGGYATRHGYRLFRPSADPRLYGHLLPERRGACVYYRAQRHYFGAWHTTEMSGCIRTDPSGRTVRALCCAGDHVVGQPYRVRVEWHGNKAWLRKSGSWLKLMFKRH
jgi:hypothetical protein